MIGGQYILGIRELIYRIEAKFYIFVDFWIPNAINRAISILFILVSLIVVVGLTGFLFYISR